MTEMRGNAECGTTANAHLSLSFLLLQQPAASYLPGTELFYERVADVTGLPLPPPPGCMAHREARPRRAGAVTRRPDTTVLTSFLFH